MDQTNLIILIVVLGLSALGVVAMLFFANSSSQRASKRIYSAGGTPGWGQPQGQQPMQQGGNWNQYKQPCPPSAQPGCVPAKLVEPSDEYIAIRVRANACGCSSSEIGEQLQMIADMTQNARDSQARSALEQQLLDVLGGTRKASKAG